MQIHWWISFCLAVVLIIAFMGFAIGFGKYRKTKKIKLLPIAMLVCFSSAMVLAVPAFCAQYSLSGYDALASVAMALGKAIKVFGGDSIYEEAINNINSIPEQIRGAYIGAMLLVQVWAPLCTISVLLSALKNISSFLHYYFGHKRDTYVFSSLNAKSYELAKSIRANDKRCVLVFTDINDSDNDSINGDLLNEVKKLKAISFSRDILAIDFKRHSPKKKLIFIMINDDETVNIAQGLKVLEEYRDRDNTEMYVVTTATPGELLLTAAQKGKMIVKRINETASLINRIIYEDKMGISENAIDVGKKEKLVSALVVGMGSHGTEMVKTLSWYCQMDGFELLVNAFDADSLAEDKFRAKAPELMSDKFNGKNVPGEAHYTINIHSGINVETETFRERIREIKNISYVLVSLGDDELNIKTAVMLRILFEQMGIKPYIHAIVYSSEQCRALKGLCNFKGKSYDIDFTGDLSSSYSADMIFENEIAKLALKCHFGWGGNEQDFWNYEYNYRSSMAAAMHILARRRCKIPFADKKVSEMTDDEIKALGYLEHRRWNAYMRSQGYIYSGSQDSSTRNDLGFMHHNLVPNGVLELENYKKDLNVGIN